VPACGLGVKVIHDSFDGLKTSLARPISAPVPFVVHAKEGDKPNEKHESSNKCRSSWEWVGCVSGL
jgi:hypothetical protein